MGTTGTVVSATGRNRLRAVALVAVAAFATLIALAFAPSGGVAASSKSFRILSLDTTAVVQEDASMDVVERATYRFDGGPFNFGIRSFESDNDRIEEFAVSDELGPLVVIPPSESISGDWEWELREPTYDDTITYTVTYRVDGAVTMGSDVGDLNWRFLGTEHPGFGQVDIAVSFPPGIPPAPPDVADDDTSVLRGFAHGPSNGVVSVEESLVTASVSDVDAGQFVEIRALAPAEFFTVTGTEPLLADALEEERDIAEQDSDADAKEDRRGLIWVLGPLVAALGVFGTGALWFTGGREKKSQEVLGEYWREPLTERPAVAIINLQRGTVPTGQAMAGTIVDLAQRGYLRIVGEKQERFGKDDTLHRYIWTGKQFEPDVVEYEKDVLEMTFRGTGETTSDEVDAWARSNQKTAQAKLAEIKSGMKAEYNKFGFEEGNRGRHQALLVGVCVAVAVGGIAVTSYTGVGSWWMPLLGAVLLLGIGSRALMNRTQAGAEAAAKAQGLKKFLQDFSQLEDAPVGHLILWERYLVYAVTLGVSAELLYGLTTRVPAVVNDPNFSSWYVGTSGARFGGFDQMESRGASLVSASTPKNTSGSGGGFSGGGGSSGGGGGGGFGAR